MSEVNLGVWTDRKDSSFDYGAADLINPDPEIVAMSSQPDHEGNPAWPLG
jgi:hypothetical protein